VVDIIVPFFAAAGAAADLRVLAVVFLVGAFLRVPVFAVVVVTWYLHEPYVAVHNIELEQKLQAFFVHCSIAWRRLVSSQSAGIAMVAVTTAVQPGYRDFT
jgi:hypothetical protein